MWGGGGRCLFGYQLHFLAFSSVLRWRDYQVAMNQNARCIFHPTESTDSSKEKVHGSFTTEVAVEYAKSQNEPPSHTPESDAPFDPNLQCEKCGCRYREGQIQNYKKHTNECVGN